MLKTKMQDIPWVNFKQKRQNETGPYHVLETLEPLKTLDLRFQPQSQRITARVVAASREEMMDI